MTDYTQLLAELGALQGRLVMNDAHRYSFDKAWVPNVTTIVKSMDAPDLDRWSVRVQVEGTARAAWGNPRQPEDTEGSYIERLKMLAKKQKEHERLSDEAKIIGKDVHVLIEHALRVDLGLPSRAPTVCEDALYRFAGFRQWAKAVGLKPLAVESRVICLGVVGAPGYCGTFDALVLVEGRLTLLDWKPNKELYPERRLQLAAYRKALVSLGWPEMEGAIVCVPRDGGDISMVYAEPPGEDLDYTYGAFLSLLAVYRWQAQVEKWKRAERRRA